MAKMIQLDLEWQVRKSFVVEVPDSYGEDEIFDMAFDCEDEFRDLKSYTPCPVEIDYDGSLISILSLESDDEDFDPIATSSEEVANG